MLRAAPPHQFIRFDCFEVDFSSKLLRKHGIKLKLGDQSFEVLAFLLERPGEVVTREELRGRLWPKDVFVDFDNNLNTAVARLREALGDSADHPRFIETLPKRGYRFIAPCSGAAMARPRLLVLPFANLSADPAQEYLGDAITEEIISALAELAPDKLAVIARTTAMQYKGRQKDVARIGRELAVDYVVEGSVARAGDRFGISARLIHAADQAHVWAKKYDINASQVSGMPGSMAREVAHELHVEADARGRSRGRVTEDPVAYDLYLKGTAALYRATSGSLADSRRFLEEAIARDPGFEPPHSRLAELFWYLGFLGYAPPKEVCSAGIFYALRAIEIDSTVAETHALLGQYRKELDYNWEDVEREMRWARELNPVSPVVRLRYAMSLLLPQGRLDEAVAELEAALESDPRSELRIWLAQMLALRRDYDQGMEHARAVVELDPTNHFGHFMMGQLLCAKQMFDEGLASHRKAVELSGGAPIALGWLGMVLAQAGNSSEARSLLDRLHAMAGRAYVPPTSIAWIHLGLGEIDAAFTWMDKAIDARDPMMAPIKTYPFLDPVRGDPRFAALLHRMNLEP